jgi:hypothetical protein
MVCYRDVGLSELTDTEKYKELEFHGIAHAKRFISRETGPEVNLNTFLITYITPNIPISIHIDHYNVRAIMALLRILETNDSSFALALSMSKFLTFEATYRVWNIWVYPDVIMVTSVEAQTDMPCLNRAEKPTRLTVKTTEKNITASKNVTNSSQTTTSSSGTAYASNYMLKSFSSSSTSHQNKKKNNANLKLNPMPVATTRKGTN